MVAVEIDMGAGAAIAIIALWQKGEPVPGGKERTRTRLDLPAELILLRAGRRLAGFRAVPFEAGRASD